MRKFVVTRYVEVLVRGPVIEAKNEKEAIEKFDKQINLHDTLESGHLILNTSQVIKSEKVNSGDDDIQINYVEFAENYHGALIDELLENKVEYSEKVLTEDEINKMKD